ncbi:hypothetical protein DYB32_002947 [Aphanomyces invadans]|uniref:Subtilisin n=1 Tax=Aphanomyces invadans TaxID=157072 RepID=A0A3R6YC79_9STRA|nr:hypothetical protein DYB32_002947 [Aphanomyces invadans]
MSVQFNPATEIVPKHETLASQLVQLYPEYDGRNTVVAIFDTGVDPGAPGLQITSDGKRKIIDVVDATVRLVRIFEFGDVDMSTILKPTDGKLVLPSGKVLTLNPAWKASEFRVGSKRAYELYPKLLVDRIKKERKEKWQAKDREAINAVQKELADWTSANSSNPSQAAIDARKDIQARLAVLEANSKLFEDPGPIYDAVAFYDGTHWRAAVDTSETGDFSTSPAFTNYRVAHEYGKFCDASQLNYVLNLYDNGSVLSIVCDAGAHGTHVAGIVAAYHEDDPINNGVAPGAQIVSVKIGDTRMGSMETVLGITRGYFVEHSWRLYTWSSRGPTFDGDLGVNICAPGCAITSVPNWTLTKKMLMNGTSMSSPNAAGNVALLISGLKHRNIGYNPFSIRRALENTAVSISTAEAFAQGQGLIQTLPALEYLFKHQNTFDGTKEFPLYYDIRVPSHQNNRGIYLRELDQLAEKDFNVNVEPIFHKDARNDHRIQFELSLKLVPTKPWIATADHLTLLHQGRYFKVSVNSDALTAGAAHFGEVIAYDTKNLGLFMCALSKVIPAAKQHAALQLVKELEPANISRTFYQVPAGATWVNVSVSRRPKSAQEPAAALYSLHLMQLEKYERQGATSLQKNFYLNTTGQVTHSFAVKGLATLELCLAQYWNSIGSSTVHLEVDFRGIVPDERSVHVTGGVGSTKVNLFAHLRSESIEPSAVLNKWTQRLRPDSAVVSTLGSRDVFDDNRHMYQLVLTYSFEKAEEGKITPSLPLLNGRLYESPFESQLILIFDTNKKYLGCSDAYPRSTSLKKGKFILRAQVRHEDPSVLENLKSMMAFVTHDIKDVTVTVYDSPNDPSFKGKALSASPLKKGVYRPVYVGEPAFDKLPKGAATGDILSGKITYGRKSTDVKGYSYMTRTAVRFQFVDRVTQKPDGYPLSYTVPAKPTVEKEPEAKEAEVSTASIVSAIDADALAVHYGVKLVPGDVTQSRVRKVKDSEKAALVDALSRQARALDDLKDEAAFVVTFQALQKWVDTDDNQFVYASIHNDLRQGHKGMALKRLQKVLELATNEMEKIIPLKEVRYRVGWRAFVTKRCV